MKSDADCTLRSGLAEEEQAMVKEAVPRAQDQRISAATVILLAVLMLFALALVIAATGWEYSRDTPLLNYVGFLIWEHGYAPYVDVFETSMPGTLAWHALLAGLGLAENTAFMVLAIAIVLATAALGALAILPLGRAGALLAFPLTVIAMLIMGPGWILKIDMVALLPIAAALCLALHPHLGALRSRQFTIGLLFGLVATMKPHLMLGAPVVVLAAFAIEHWSGQLRDMPVGELFRQIGLSLLGFVLPILLTVIWLVAAGAYSEFIFVLTGYLPLHLEKTGWQEFLPAEERQWIKFTSFLRLGGYFPLVPIAALAPLLAFHHRSTLDSRTKITLISLCLLAVIYGLAPGIGGQFYVYYYFPFFFFSLLLIAASFSVVERAWRRPSAKAIWAFCMGSLLAAFGSQFYSPDLFNRDGLPTVARIEAALTRWVPEDGRVQPIDWTSGVVHAMLRQGILPATPYLYDYHFHHHVGSPTNEALRTAFMAKLEADPPEVFVEAKKFPRVFGLNTTDRFPRRDAFVAERYRLAADEETFRVFLRRDLAIP